MGCGVGLFWEVGDVVGLYCIDLEGDGDGVVDVDVDDAREGMEFGYVGR